MTRFWIVVLAVVAITSPARADTQSIDATLPRVTPLPARTVDGAAQHRVPLAVPTWRGLEPALAIAYASTTKNAFLGVGMTLEGLSTIERVSAGLGVPTYTASDTYQIDGEPMFPCAAGSASPSCMTGGTHTTKHERYARIVKSGTTWIVTSPSGVVDRYTTFAEPVAVLTSRTDPSGNAVTYSYGTADGTTYLDSIAYNGTAITFAREARPDSIRIGVGGGHRRIDQRLAAVAIRTDGVLVRAYRLAYVSGAHGRSYLASVQEYGSDATFNAAGAVTGGSALPATSFGYTSDAIAGFSGWSTTVTRPAGHSAGDESFVADVNGDGRADAISVFRQTTASVSSTTGTLQIQVQLGGADGRFSTAPLRASTTSNAEIGRYDVARVGDVNGDGRADLVFVYRSSVFPCCGAPATGFIDVQLALGTGSGGFTFPLKNRISSIGEATQFDQVQLADVNGDGSSDLILTRVSVVSGVAGSVTALVSLSNGTRLGSVVSSTFLGGTPFATYRIHAGDVDGDNRDDLVVVLRGSSLCGTGSDSATAHTYLSRGDGRFGGRISSTLHTGCQADYYAGDWLVDVNGDGLADLVGDDAYSITGAVCSDCDSDVRIATNLGNGDGTFGGALVSNVWSGSGAGIGYWTAGLVDVNGDGYADRVGALGGGTMGLLVSYGRGDGFFHTGFISHVSTGTSTAWANAGGIGFADVDGDGRLSLVATSCEGLNVRLATLGPTSQFAGLLGSVTLPTGGTVQLGYATSSSYANGYLPFAFSVIARSDVLDGRGQTATTTYSYTGGLYVPSERRFFGFATARVKDGTGALRDLAYTQHVADPPGTLASTHERAADGTLVRYETTAFARAGDGSTAPYVSQPTRRYTYECHGQPTCKAASRGWTYTAYGAVASEIEYGDDAITGDERTTFHTQVVNPTAFLTRLDATVTVRAGASNPAGTQLAYTEHVYDAGVDAASMPTRGLVAKRSRWRGGASYVVERWQYDAAGNETAAIDPLGNTTAKAYDARQRLVLTVNPLGHSETRTYDALGRLASITDANGGTTSHVYDALGRLVRRTSPDGAVATAAFTNLGSPTTQSVTTAISDGTADGLWTQTYFDGLGRPVRTVVEGNVTTDTTYDVRGLVVARTAPYVPPPPCKVYTTPPPGAAPCPPPPPPATTTTYDAVGRPLRVVEADGTATVTRYGNWTVSTTDPRGLVTDRAYDGYRQLAQVVERLAAPQTTTIAYDLLGRRVRVVDAKGNVAMTAYDPLGRRVESQDPDLGLWQYGYDDAGHVTTQRDARGVTIEMTYDALGRPLQRSSGATALASFRYDEVSPGYANIGRLTGFTDPTGATQRRYDAGGRLRQETKTIGDATYQLDWSYDAAGRVASIQYPDVDGAREQVALTYSASGRVTSVGGYVWGIGYDARGNVTDARYGNGATVARTYSPTRGWMLGQTVTSGGTVRDQLEVTRAPSGDITARTSTTDARDAWQFTYDALGRLVGADHPDNALDEAFTYDALGDRLTGRRGSATTTYAYPAAGAARPHAPLTIAGLPVRYDANGNRLGIGASPDAIYDENNRLVDDGTTTYAYDAEGTRVRAGDKVFVRDLFETDGATSVRYYYLGKERVARRDQTGAVAYYHGDSIGTVRTITADTGAVAGTKLGFAFGQLAATTGLADPFGLAGQRLDGSGLYHMGARMMDPAHGQFTQPDPSGAPDPDRPQSLNRYTYAANNPIRLVDPTGFREEDEEERKKRDPRAEPGTADEPRGTRRSKTGKGSATILRVQDKGDEVPELYSKEYEALRRQTLPRSLLGTIMTVPFHFESATGRTYHHEDNIFLRGGTVVIWPIHSDGFLNGTPDVTTIAIDMQRRAADLSFWSKKGRPVPDAFYMEGSGSHIIHRFDPDTNDLRVVPPSSVPASGLTDIYYDEALQLSGLP